MSEISTVAVIGTGVIGRSWIRVFARAGLRVRAHDPDPAQLEKALASIPKEFAEVTSCATLSEAVMGADYVQESGPERLAKKQAIFAELDRAAEPRAILASSSSALDTTEIASGLSGAARILVAHPVNPPHVVPVVEILPGATTDPAVVDRACRFLSSVGQAPVRLNFFVPGYLLNRMQAALIREAIDLVRRGVADVEAVDTVIRDGLGLRWALMGPFAVANTNADGGVREYFTRYADAYKDLMNDLGPTPDFDSETIEAIGTATDEMFEGIERSRIREWRDRMVEKLRAMKEQDALR